MQISKQLLASIVSELWGKLFSSKFVLPLIVFII